MLKLKQMKLAALQSSKRLGVLSRVGRSSWRTHRLLILGYHGVSLDDEHLWNPALYMSQDALRHRLELLRRNDCSVLSLREAVSRLGSNNLPPRSVVLTFDDGAYDFFARAFPIIRAFGFPVTVYQTSYYSGFNRPVFDVACDYVLWKGAGKRIEGLGFTGTPGLLDLSTEEDRSSVYVRIREAARREGMSAEDQDALLERLAAALEVDSGAMRAKRLLHLMKPEELQQLISVGVDVQLHTHRHRMPRNRDLFAREICDNRAALAAVGQSSADHFCYPSGEYDATFLPWLAELGVQSATTCDSGLASSNTPLLLLPRCIDSSGLSDVEFEGWLSGVSQLLPRRATRRTTTLDMKERTAAPLLVSRPVCRAEVVPEASADWQLCERSLAMAGVRLPLPHRTGWALARRRIESRGVVLRSPEGEYAGAFGVHATPSRVLPGFRVLRVERFGEAVPRALWSAAVDALAELARREPRLLRLSVEVYSRAGETRARLGDLLGRAGFTRAATTRNWSATLTLDLAPGEQELFASFTPSARKSIRSLTKLPVEVRLVDDDRWASRLEALSRETRRRTGGRYEALWNWSGVVELSRRMPDAARLVGLFRTDREGPEALLGFAWGCWNGESACYFAGGSSRPPDLHRVQIGYPLVWDLIQWAKRSGATWFDFGGVTAGTAASGDPMGGISDFKRSFSNQAADVAEDWVFEPRRLLLLRLVTLLATGVDWLLGTLPW